MKDGRFEVEDRVKLRSSGVSGPIGRVVGFIPGAITVRWSSDRVTFHPPVDLVLVSPDDSASNSPY
ncbi:MAG: hypothetical protein RB191_00285 [Terriglobia bacterium]|nr:hypothetical protein [Terriglobia bacterium]